MSLKGINNFEKNKPEIAVNVLSYEKQNVFPLRISKMNREKTVNLLLLKNDQRKPGLKHYRLIKNMSRLLSSQTSGHNGKKEFCLRCLNHFSNNENLAKHLEYCESHETVKLKMPEKGSIVELKNFKHSMRAPIVVYADFECFTKPIQTCQPNPE